MTDDDLLEIKQYLAEELSIGIETSTDSEDGHHTITVQLFLDGVEISSETNYLFHK